MLCWQDNKVPLQLLLLLLLLLLLSIAKIIALHFRDSF